MEIFAFTQVAIDFEDSPIPPMPTLASPAPSPCISHLTRFGPRAVAVGIASSTAALSLLASPAQAAVGLGDFCEAVGAVQAALAARNYAPGGIDNNFGLFTERAVRNFQRLNNITPDGTVGPTTAVALGLPPGPYAAGVGCSDGAGSGGSEPLATVTADVLNIRSGPSLSSPVVGELFQGTRVQVLQTSGGWSEIASTAAGEAWVSSAYLLGGDVVTPPVVVPTPATVTADVLNIRAQPSTAAPIIGELFQGNQVQVVRTAGDWTEIASAAGEAWVASAYLTGGGSGSGGGSGAAIGPMITTASGNGANVRAFPDGPRVYGLPDGATVRLNGVTRLASGLEWSQLTDGNWVVSSVLI